MAKITRYLGLVAGAATESEPALSAWEVSVAARVPSADSLTCGCRDRLSVTDRELP